MKKVLIVEDDLELLALEEAMLKKEYEIATVSSGEEALEKIYDFKPDLVLLDVLLPKMSGFEVCQKVRKDPAISKLPIVMLTGQDRAEALSEGFESGADMYINKPFSAKKLQAVVKAVLEKQVG